MITKNGLAVIAVLAVGILTIFSAHPARAQSSQDVRAPDFCSEAQTGAKQFVCDTRSLWTTHAVFEWELEAAAEALGEAKKVAELDKLKERASQWRASVGAGCQWSVIPPAAEMQRCLDAEYRSRSNEIVAIQRDAGLQTPEMAEAQRREADHQRKAQEETQAQQKANAEERVRVQAKLDAEVAELKAKFDAQRAEQQARQDEMSRQNLMYLVGIFAIGLLGCAAIVLVRRWWRLPKVGADAVNSRDEIPGRIRSSKLRWTFYGACGAVALSAIVGAVALQSGWIQIGEIGQQKPSSTPAGSAQSSMKSTAASPGVSARPAERPLTGSEMRQIWVEEAIKTSSQRGQVCALYGRHLEQRWGMLQRNPNLPLAVLDEVIALGEGSGCWN